MALGWALPDEGRKGIAVGVLASLSPGRPAIVPAHWQAEVGNGLLMAHRRGRLDGESLPLVLAELSNLPVMVDAHGAADAWTRPFAEALGTGLTLYDALYLELAKRLALPLATLDAALRHAGKKTGLAVVP